MESIDQKALENAYREASQDTDRLELIKEWEVLDEEDWENESDFDL